MSVRPVLLWPDPLLSVVCTSVEQVDPALIDDMFETMYAARGRGLAAPQIGVMQRVFVVDVTWKEGVRSPRVFINPVVEKSGKDVGTVEEQCLSIPDLPMPVTTILPSQAIRSLQASTNRWSSRGFSANSAVASISITFIADCRNTSLDVSFALFM